MDRTTGYVVELAQKCPKTDNVTQCNERANYVTLNYVTLNYVTLNHVTLNHVTLNYVTLNYVTLN